MKQTKMPCWCGGSLTQTESMQGMAMTVEHRFPEPTEVDSLYLGSLDNMELDVRRDYIERWLANVHDRKNSQVSNG